MVEIKTLSVLLMKEQDEDGGAWWVAQCLEHDIATQARAMEDALYDIERIIAGQVLLGAQFGTEPFAHIPAAPAEYWERYLHVRAARGIEIRHSPEFAAPPRAFIRPVIEARVAA